MSKNNKGVCVILSIIIGNCSLLNGVIYWYAKKHMLKPKWTLDCIFFSSIFPLKTSPMIETSFKKSTFSKVILQFTSYNLPVSSVSFCSFDTQTIDWGDIVEIKLTKLKSKFMMQFFRVNVSFIQGNVFRKT